MLLTPNFRPKSSQPISQHPHKGYITEASGLDHALLASSPNFARSLFGPYTSTSSSDIDSSTIPRASQEAFALAPSPSTASQSNFSDLSSGDDNIPELMQSENWAVANSFTPRSVKTFSHNRESSLSSLGSAGPSSPFSHNTSNPQIAVTDSTNDGFTEMHAADNYHYQLGKPMQPNPDGLFSAYPQHYNAESTMPDMVYPAAVAMHKPKSERSNLLPALAFSSTFGPARSQPGSVASSVGGDSPATPSLGEPEDDRRRKLILHNAPPKLDRTMTDVYGDELYNPNFTITSASPSHMSIPTSPGNEVFAQRLQAANSQHLSAVQSPTSMGSRSRSPFRQGSPLAPTQNHDFNSGSPAVRFHSAQQMREQSKAENDARVLQQQLAMKSEPETPKTISPKDAVLEFHDSDGGANFPLFPEHDSTEYLYEQANKMSLGHVQTEAFQPRTHSNHESNQYRYQHLSPGVQIPQQYPFIPQTRISTNSPSHFSSADSSSGESHQPPLLKPRATGADGGTYTCTYHGCTLRFESPALLQKHKREGHRQAQGLTSPRKSDAGDPAGLLNSQAGPHKCERINPSTGKSCNTIFSRPYDLTRHEDTIHNARKQKVRCGLCTEEKTFSRADALTRHYRVCHPDVEFPGKHRRRGGHA